MVAVVEIPRMTSGSSYKVLESCLDLKIDAGSYYIPKNRESNPQGEDFHFISHAKQTIGIADGVGGWAKKGIDAGEYARKLMKNCVQEIRHKHIKDIVPKLVLKEAFNRTNAKGSSTACVLTVKGDFLHAVNVGDSGFKVVRGGVAVYESPVQQHVFNKPFQLGKGVRADSPDSGLEIIVPVEPGDVIVAGTDGLFDNVYVKDIEKIVREGIENGVKAKVLARKIAKLAQKKASSADFSPFAMAARMAGVELKHTGGKHDDITVVISYVVRDVPVTVRQNVVKAIINYTLRSIQKVHNTIFKCFI